MKNIYNGKNSFYIINIREFILKYIWQIIKNIYFQVCLKMLHLIISNFFQTEIYKKYATFEIYR